MTQSDIQQILEKLNEINTRLDNLERSADLAEAYRQGTQWVVNLAFSLIVATTIGIILKFVVGN